jgi:cystathionine beta-lyase family protein involved in aluminum resistance
MQHNRLSERHFSRSTGYGYNDEGREVCEKIFAEVFGGEKALVRPQIVSGTHAIALSLFGLLRPGDELLSITGTPYDTIQTVIGLNEEYLGDGTLKEYNITYSQVNFLSNGNFDINNILNNINHNTKVIYIQRSTGYEKRSAITLNKMKSVIRKMKEYKNDLIVFIDNCYGEFIEQQEPLNVGADVIAGSLIKNPGGGLAESGGYIVGKENYVKKIAARLTTPGLDFEVGANWGVVRS